MCGAIKYHHYLPATASEFLQTLLSSNNKLLWLFGALPPGGGVLPYIRYIGMCRPKGYGF